MNLQVSFKLRGGGDALIFIDELLHIDLETGEMLFAFCLLPCFIFFSVFAILVKHECSALNSTPHKHFTFNTSLQDRQQK